MSKKQNNLKYEKLLLPNKKTLMSIFQANSNIFKLSNKWEIKYMKF